jgi:hypothetical protein
LGLQNKETKNDTKYWFAESCVLPVDRLRRLLRMYAWRDDAVRPILRLLRTGLWLVPMRLQL